MKNRRKKLRPKYAVMIAVDTCIKKGMTTPEIMSQLAVSHGYVEARRACVEAHRADLAVRDAIRAARKKCPLPKYKPPYPKRRKPRVRIMIEDEE